MTHELLSRLIFFAGIAHLCILSASALVPFHLNWKEDLASLPRLHRQMYWVYGGYVVLSIIAFALLSLLNSQELAAGGGLARGFCLYVAVFWAIRVTLQGVFDVKPHLSQWWLKLGYHSLTFVFLYFVIVFGWAAVFPPH